MRMLKFMAWERSFEARVLAIRDKELHFQRRNFFIEASHSMLFSQAVS